MLRFLHLLYPSSGREWAIAFGVALLDALTTYLGIKDREAWIDGNIRRGLGVEALTAVAVGVNVCVFVDFTWSMIMPSVIGAVFGRYAAWRW